MENSDKILFDVFLNASSNGFRQRGYVERMNERLVDIKSSSRHVNIFGLYSILFYSILFYSIQKNNWRIFPDRDVYAKIDKAEILKLYYERKAKIDSDILNFRNTLKGEEFVNRVSAYYTEQFDLYANFKSYLVFKLLSKTGVLRKIGKTSVRSRRKQLSLYTQEELEKMETFRKARSEKAVFDLDSEHSEDAHSDDTHSQDFFSV